MARTILKIQTTEATEVIHAPGGVALFDWTPATTSGLEYDNSSGNVIICLRQTGVSADTTATIKAVVDKFHRTQDVTSTPTPISGNPGTGVVIMHVPLDGYGQTSAQNRVFIDISTTGDASTLLVAALR
jgi:hypothetical protein